MKTHETITALALMTLAFCLVLLLASMIELAFNTYDPLNSSKGNQTIDLSHLGGK